MAIQDIIDFLEKNYHWSNPIDTNGDSYVMAFVLPLGERFSYFTEGGPVIPTILLRFDDDKKKVVVIEFPKPLKCRSPKSDSIKLPYVIRVSRVGYGSDGKHDLSGLKKLFNELMSLRPEPTTKKVNIREIKELLPGALDLANGCRILVIQATPELLEDAQSLAKDIRNTHSDFAIIAYNENIVTDSYNKGNAIIVTMVSHEDLIPRINHIGKDLKTRVVKLTASPYKVKSKYEVVEFP